MAGISQIWADDGRPKIRSNGWEMSMLEYMNKLDNKGVSVIPCTRDEENDARRVEEALQASISRTDVKHHVEDEDTEAITQERERLEREAQEKEEHRVALEKAKKVEAERLAARQAELRRLEEERARKSQDEERPDEEESIQDTGFDFGG